MSQRPAEARYSGSPYDTTPLAPLAASGLGTDANCSCMSLAEGLASSPNSYLLAWRGALPYTFTGDIMLVNDFR